MTLKDAITYVKMLIDDALSELGYPSMDYSITEPKPEYGDLASNVAYQLKVKGKSPNVIASEIKDKIVASIGKSSMVRSVHVINGYINFRLDHVEFTRLTLKRILTMKDRYGSLDIGKGKRVLVEHTSVNPNKALHIGHVRNLVLGDSIYRLLRFTGHDAYVLNYIDDSGLQVADIIVGFKYLKMPLESNKKFDHYCGDDIYVKVNEMYEHDTSLLEKRREVLKDMEDYYSDTASFAREITGRVLREQLSTCWRLNARYDCLNFESQIIASELWSKALKMMSDKGIVERIDDPSSKYNGCIVIKAGVEGEEKVLVRSDGTATYIAKDIPYAMWKLGALPSTFKYVKYTQQYDSTILYATSLNEGTESVRFNGADIAITVIDVRQSRLQSIISKILSMLGYDSHRYRHLAYEVVALSANTASMLDIDIGDRRFAHMKGREGIYINADTILDMLHAKAYDEVKSRNPDADEQWLHDTAEKIAVSAIRYIMLKYDLDKIITFDIQDSLNLQGDTAQYIQYAYARAYRILERSGYEMDGLSLDDIDPSLLNDDKEIALVRALARFEAVVENALSSLSPKLIARYAYALASLFNEFYEHVPVLAGDEHIKHARLILLMAYMQTVSNCMNLLGLHVLRSM
jgi:arginyl-tRNA synthetase